MTPDHELLHRYAQTRSEDAFAELVRRHVNLVYSVALRRVNGDTHLAQDVAQTVFTDLARKAGSLARRESLTGWLYTSAYFAAAKMVRTENRRRDREDKFMREPTPTPAPEAEWEKLRPELDEAMHELKEADREAVLLRYFENRQFADVGTRLGLNENAARMRVKRALEKLRAAFLKRGVTATTALASVISANAVQLAPANLAATLTTTSIAAAGTGTFTFLKIMTAAKLKLAFSALIVASAATVLMVQHQTQTKLREENQSLRRQITQLQADDENLSNRLAAAGNSKLLSDEQFDELLKLRSEVTRLRHGKNILPEAALLETNNANPEPIEIHLKVRFVSLPAEDLQGLGVDWLQDARGIKTGLLTEQQFKVIHEALQGASDAELISQPEVTASNGQQTRMSTTQSVPLNGTNMNIGASLVATSYFSTNSSTFNLNLIAQLTQLTGDSSQPGMQTIQATNQVILYPGQTVVLEAEIPPGGRLPDSTNIPAGPRSLLVFVTPQVVDSHGQPTNFAPPNQ
jgi:RNA polymerase sigma factor (sigma-70 family)